MNLSSSLLTLHRYGGILVSLFDQVVHGFSVSVNVCVCVHLKVWPCVTIANDNLSVTGARAGD